MGEWEGMTWEEIKSRESEALKAFIENSMEHSAPGGECHQDVINRAAPWIDGALKEEKGDFAVISHGITIVCILKYLFRDNPGTDVSVRMGNTSITTVEYNQMTKEIQLVQLNYNGFI